MLIISKNALKLKETSRIMFDQISLQPLAQSSWHTTIFSWTALLWLVNRIMYVVALCKNMKWLAIGFEWLFRIMDNYLICNPKLFPLMCFRDFRYFSIIILSLSLLLSHIIFPYLCKKQPDEPMNSKAFGLPCPVWLSRSLLSKQLMALVPSHPLVPLEPHPFHIYFLWAYL